MKIKFGFLCLFCVSILLGCVNKFERVNYSNILTKSDYGTDIEMNYYFKGLLEFKLIAPSVEQLKEAGVFYDQLIMGLGGGERILINDLKPDSDNPTAHAINLIRNKGVKDVEV